MVVGGEGMVVVRGGGGWRRDEMFGRRWWVLRDWGMRWLWRWRRRSGVWVME